MRSLSKPAATVLCFGEVLWDCLPRGLFLGGAPLNVAYHLQRHGVRALPISAVGQDFLGDEALRRITSWGVDPRFIARLPRVPTGLVRVALNARGEATYRIVRGVAWDRIAATAALQRRSPAPAAIVFGTLALREEPNRRALHQLLTAWPDAWRVADLNLRPPFDRRAAVDFVLGSAQLVKLNADELAQLTSRRTKTRRQIEHAVAGFAHSSGVARVCVTAGAEGAGLWWDGQFHWEPARPVQVRDTIGAGDAFLGALLASVLVCRASPAEALVHACRMGEFIASRDGATPPYALDRSGTPIDR